ncbi:putative malate/L-lactate dehydrogenase [Halenospora varia]|nr:putative malate/L-lactate dehydrogenase [Halenospora varia]
MSSSPDQKFHIAPEAASKFAISLLKANGVPAGNAEVIAKCLVMADLRGVDTHGMNRFPSYLKRLCSGAINHKGSPTLKQITPCVAQVDGCNTFGFLGAELGMRRCIEMAKEHGIGMVSVKRSNHFGMSAWIVQQANEAGMLSLVFTNSSAALPVWGGREKMMGVSPIACGAPGPKGAGKDFILDMAPSIAARGKVYKALRRGENIPIDWAIDGEGKRTTDPARALEGSMLPMGGPKGSALAVMMDVFSGVLSGSKFAGRVIGPYEEGGEGRESDVGHFLLAIRPDLFLDGGEEEFKERMSVLYDRVVGSKKMEGVDRIYFPGEIEQELHKERLRSGIPFVKAEVDALNKEAEKVGSPKLELMDRAKL